MTLPNRSADIAVTQQDLLAQLSSPDESTRLQAVQSLSSEESTSIPALIGALGDENWRVRRAAVNGLTRHLTPENIATVLHALQQNHSDLSILNSALQILALADTEIVVALSETLHDPDPDLRTYAALALGEQHHPQTIPALMTALEDEDANVRYHVIEALGKLRVTEATPALLKLAKAGDFFLAFPALDALAHIADPSITPHIVPLLEDEMLGQPAAELLGQLGGAEVVRPLASLLSRADAPVAAVAGALAEIYDRYETQSGTGDHIADLTRAAIDTAGAQNLLNALDQASSSDLRALAMVAGWLEGPAIEQALARLLGKPDARREVVDALVRHGRQVSQLLVKQLSADDLETRQAAAIALGRIGDRGAVPALVETLGQEEHLSIVAIEALAKINDPQAFDALLSMLGHPSAAVRQTAVSALNTLGHPEMPERILALLSDPNPRVRESAVKIAGYFGYEIVTESLLAACDDPDERVRVAAVEHLPYLDDQRMFPRLTKALRAGTPKVRAAAARALGHAERTQALSPLLMALEDADAWVRYYAAQAIGRHSYQEAIDTLAQLIRQDSVPFVRIAAIGALGASGDENAIVVLAPLVKAEEYDIARATLHALGQIRHSNALPPLLAALSHNDPRRRIDAINALSEHGGAEIITRLQQIVADDPGPEVVQVAIDALARLNAPAAGSSLATQARLGMKSKGAG